MLLRMVTIMTDDVRGPYDVIVKTSWNHDV